jgi:hypothetical protein
MYGNYSEAEYEAYLEELQEQSEEKMEYDYEDERARLDYEDSQYEMRKELGWL